MAEAAGIADTYNGRGIALADFNHDGWVDMYIANQGAPSCYYLNRTGAAVPGSVEGTEARRHEGTDTRSRDGHGAGSEQRALARAARRSDEATERRGDEGSGSVNRQSTIVTASRRGNTASFLWLKLVGRPDLPNRVAGRALASTRDAVGARVTLWSAGGGRQVREVQGGMGFASQSEHAVHFGVPDPAAVERITIDWPSGRRQEFTGDDARTMMGRHILAREADDDLAAR